MRTTIAILVMLVAGTGRAELVWEPAVFESNLSQNSSYFVSPVTTPQSLAPLDFHWTSYWPGPEPITYTLTGLTPEHLHQQLTITADNAAEIGLDWEYLVTGARRPWRTDRCDVFGNCGDLDAPPTYATADTPLGQLVSDWASTPGDSTYLPYWAAWSGGPIIDRVRIVVSEFNYNPNDRVTYVQIGTILHGEVPRQLIPEPASSILATLAMYCLFGTRRAKTNAQLCV